MRRRAYCERGICRPTSRHKPRRFRSGEQRQHRTGGNRSAEQVALRLVRAVPKCRRRLRVSLDPLRRDGKIEAAAEADDCAHKNIAFGANAKSLDEASINLELVEL